ncbi:MAG: LuxR C-terminal-related transcriptional regulator [Actinomycetota bacterium]
MRTAGEPALQAIVEACRRPTDTTSLIDDVWAAMSEVVTADGAFISATDPATTIFASAALIENMPESMCAPFMENEFLVDDFNKFADLHRTRSGPSTLHRVTCDRPIRSLRYVEVNNAMGFGPELRATFSADGACWGVIDLLRERTAPDFDVADLEFVEAVAPILADGLRRSMLGALARSPAASGTPGVITLDERGRVASLTDQAVSLLADLNHGPIVTGSTFDLPGEAYVVAASARAQALGRPAPPAFARVQGRGGGWLTLRGDCSRSPDGRVESTVVIVERSRPSDVLPLVVAAYELSAREEEVLAELTTGRTTSEIAANLFISRHTVRDHIKSILEKTSTTSRGELLSRLFNLHYYQETEFIHRRS